jgi:hypothetical protein
MIHPKHPDFIDPFPNNPVEIEIVDTELKIQVDQPKPPFTLLDLSNKLSQAYDLNTQALKILHNTSALTVNANNCVKEANSLLQELVAIVAQASANFETIEMPKPTSDIVNETFSQENPQFWVSGVQLIEQRKLVGTSLYSTVIKARTIKDILNKKFADLRVDHEAKIIQYPVF